MVFLLHFLIVGFLLSGGLTPPRQKPNPGAGTDQGQAAGGLALVGAGTGIGLLAGRRKTSAEEEADYEEVEEEDHEV